MQTNFEVSSAQVLIDTPKISTEKIVLFIPGVSGKARSERFLPLLQIVHEAGFAIARIDMWDSEEFLDTLTLEDINNSLNQIISILKDEGYEHAVMIGKSFGGGITLQFENDFINKKILWAPAFGYDIEGNRDTILDTPFGNIAKTSDITLGDTFLASILVPTYFIHGTEDTIIPLSNSELLEAHVPHGTLIQIENADHSFNTPESEEKLMEVTKGLLQ